MASESYNCKDKQRAFYSVIIADENLFNFWARLLLKEQGTCIFFCCADILFSWHFEAYLFSQDVRINNVWRTFKFPFHIPKVWTKGGAIHFLYIPNQWIVFFARSDWLLKLRIVFAIHLPALFWIWREFFLISQKNRTYLELAIHWFGTY